MGKPVDSSGRSVKTPDLKSVKPEKFKWVERKQKRQIINFLFKSVFICQFYIF